MKRFFKRTLFLTASLVVLSSCAKEEFSARKAKQDTSESNAITTSAKLCAQATLISPKVDILMLWDNSSSFNFVTAETKASMSKLITNVSERFDYHILSAPLIPVGATSTSGSLNEARLITKNDDNLGATALAIKTSKENAVSSLGFSKGEGSAEAGVSRTISLIQQNIGNGIFRAGAYTIIVVISNEDEKLCTSCNSEAADNNYINPKINQLAAMRSQLGSPMMRFINISRLTANSCSHIGGSVNYMYRKTARDIYNSNIPYTTDHLSPDIPGFPDSYNLCKISFAHIFDGVNTAIQETLIKHRYDHWPIAGIETSVDPETVRVVRSDGVLLTNKREVQNFNELYDDGFEVILDSNGGAANLNNKNTRYQPSVGEPFSGKLIKLYNNARVTYPDCLTVVYTEVKSTYGYIYLQYGEPNVSSIQVKINGQDVPQSATNGWDYMGLQYVSALDPSLKAVNLKAGMSSGYFLRLNGSYKRQNNVNNTFTVFYNSSGK